MALSKATLVELVEKWKRDAEPCEIELGEPVPEGFSVKDSLKARELAIRGCAHDLQVLINVLAED